jgi:hypothetical protein
VSKSAHSFLVTSLVYLGLGLAVQAVGLFDLWLGFNPLAFTSLGSTVQILLIGWLTQSLMALIYERVVAATRLATTVWICLNIGLVLAVVGQPVLVLTGNDLVGTLVAVGGLLQMAGGIMFIFEVMRAIKVR